MHADQHVHVHQTISSLLTNMDTVRIFIVGQISDTPVVEDMLNVYQEHKVTLGNKFTCTFYDCQMSEEHARSSMCCTNNFWEWREGFIYVFNYFISDVWYFLGCPSNDKQIEVWRGI